MKKLLFFAAIFCTSANVICMQTNEQKKITLARETREIEKEALEQWYFRSSTQKQPSSSNSETQKTISLTKNLLSLKKSNIYSENEAEALEQWISIHFPSSNK